MLFRNLLILVVSATAALAIAAPPSDSTRSQKTPQQVEQERQQAAAQQAAQAAQQRAARVAANTPAVNAGGYPTTGGMKPKRQRSLEDIVARAVEDHYETLALRSYIPEGGLYTRSYEGLYERDAEPAFDDIYARDVDYPEWYY
ncbi:hypothetical protein MMC15_003090 [Xylographa vitiligo]|nr:hypothetical protein [Xylographa vitiligo]